MKRALVLCVFCLCWQSAGSFAQPAAPPKWELGAAVGGQTLNNYRGSSTTITEVFPFPFLIYRGDFLKIERGGVRGEFFANERYEFNISGEMSLNGNGENGERRQGMPELDSAFELGPSFNINLTGANFNQGWALRLPVRAVGTVSTAGVDYVGYVFNPRVTYTWPRFFDHWQAKFNAGLVFGSNGYHDYYFSVAPQYATVDRPSYDAEGGFSGTYLKASLSRRHKAFWYGVNLRYDNLSDAVFADSPLVETNDYFALSFAAAWFLWHGK